MSIAINKTLETHAPFVILLLRTETDTAHSMLKNFRSVVARKLPDTSNGVIVAYEQDYCLAAVVFKSTDGKSQADLLEEARAKGGVVCKKINYEKCDSALIIRASDSISTEELMAFTEGVSLSNYQFLKYKSEKKENTLKSLLIADENILQEQLDELKTIVDANELAKNLGNETPIALNSVILGQTVKSLGETLQFKTDILQKDQIEALKMGGLLGVNYGSIVPPTFSILEYRPADARNADPLIFIGKGVTYDTGGYSLKPSASMAGMKGDMCGAAAVIGAFYAIVKNKLPIYCIGLIPSTDNRVNSNALVPDDVITMHDGTTVEVLNTDAEGRLILGDALSYAKKYNPALVIDLATLTGAAAVITGSLGSALMGTDYAYRSTLVDCGNMTFERVAEIPYWSEYGDMIKSDVADIKNIGGAVGGSATAGKFLEHFTNYPWLHLDIAGPSMLKDDEAYKQKGATGVGVRLLYAFAKKFISK